MLLPDIGVGRPRENVLVLESVQQLLERDDAKNTSIDVAFLSLTSFWAGGTRGRCGRVPYQA